MLFFSINELPNTKIYLLYQKLSVFRFIQLPYIYDLSTSIAQRLFFSKTSIKHSSPHWCSWTKISLQCYKIILMMMMTLQSPVHQYAHVLCDGEHILPDGLSPLCCLPWLWSTAQRPDLQARPDDASLHPTGPPHPAWSTWHFHVLHLWSMS